MSLYKEILRRKALKEIQKRASPSASNSRQNYTNSETYTIPRSYPRHSEMLGSNEQSSDDQLQNQPLSFRPTNQWIDRVNKLLFENCCTNMDRIYQTMESLCATLETDLGQENFASLHHNFKEAVLAEKTFEAVTAKCDAKAMAYFPLIHYLIQLELLAKQSML